jgi:hypothetical protein
MMNWKLYGRKQSWPLSRSYPDIFLEGPNKTVKYLRKLRVPAEIQAGNLLNMSQKPLLKPACLVPALLTPLRI